ncbi:hypothetical protein NJR55_05140 [Idiomarina sp. M1R2S28]|uniref:Uncharacterized protein n=1 Tax=Idiomarina rhizosphaerae TaxID=2961572 RepID=A0A9X2G2W3_9GAMM|nr:hypothetical protein [Idiomarina rhizosphaerae]MCP1338973.1 hypothetical protein [Idiomarina rhizosphaerae]
MVKLNFLSREFPGRNIGLISSLKNRQLSIGRAKKRAHKPYAYYALLEESSAMILGTKRLAMVVLFISVCSISSSVVARTCVISEGAVHDWSDKYKELIQIDTQKDEDGYMVEVSVPAKMDGKKFKHIWLFKGKPAYDATKMDHDFGMPLGTWKGSNKTIHSVYAVKSFLAKDNYLSVSYGEDCGMYVEYRVEFK